MAKGDKIYLPLQSSIDTLKTKIATASTDIGAIGSNSSMVETANSLYDYIVNGKEKVENAIKSKDGVIEKKSNVPTVSELKNGINSIPKPVTSVFTAGSAEIFYESLLGVSLRLLNSQQTLFTLSSKIKGVVRFSFNISSTQYSNQFSVLLNGFSQLTSGNLSLSSRTVTVNASVDIGSRLSVVVIPTKGLDFIEVSQIKCSIDPLVSTAFVKV